MNLALCGAQSRARCGRESARFISVLDGALNPVVSLNPGEVPNNLGHRLFVAAIEGLQAGNGNFQETAIQGAL